MLMQLRAASAAFLLLIVLFQTPITPQPIIPTPTATTQPALPAIVPADDARAAVCSAYVLLGFEPIVVAPGDTIRGLLNGSEVITITQAAALNCMDDPDALPVGAVIWLPTAALQSDDAACLYTWIEGVDNAGCPSAPITQTPAALQMFERGQMLWVGTTGEIFVLIEDGSVHVYQDTFVEGNPDPTAEAPDGLLTPVRGFAIVWEALGGATADGLLGWAAAQESSAQVTYQPAGRTSYTTYFRVDATVYAVTLYPGMESGYWVEVG